jgi:hypothetical protein
VRPGFEEKTGIFLNYTIIKYGVRQSKMMIVVFMSMQELLFSFQECRLL